MCCHSLKLCTLFDKGGAVDRERGDRRSVIEEEKERKADKSHHEGESRITDEQDYKNSSLTRCLQKIKSTNQFT